jgi:hypothetical protein
MAAARGQRRVHFSKAKIIDEACARRNCNQQNKEL